MNLWTGSIALPVKFAEIPWRDVVQTTVGTVAIDERRSRGIAIQTTAAGRIELQPLGHGFVAAFPLSKTTLGELAAEMNAHARACKERQ
ncbi:hypothetical protein ASE68_12575 [Agromyces sp. Leaf222]|nr:hypothetical protein ASE68_12575 [Agromyces sp. Leaf222]